MIITDGQILTALPRSESDWRSAFLVNLGDLNFDRFQIESGQRTIEIGENPTNGLWQLTSPVPARADQNRVNALLQTVRMSQAKEFVSDKPANLELYGLQTPSMELTFLRGTNELYAIQFGNAATRDRRRSPPPSIGSVSGPRQNSPWK